ncbi:hypothetical protein CPB84DRAFT_1305892 [Gymnopilus junonius]|uniref:F-box domain-containing protein n=1 Tax=Gymnopilus junonius TaxID=109634 RepID=A0A9P5NKT3_GYMJU|nr:hypothetical protein CPB84DRAFT_1305892 [Gymnopilus junonius]
MASALSLQLTANHLDNKFPPIAKLAQNVLWHIFSMNTHHNLEECVSPLYDLSPFYRPSSLTITRLTSQVCKRWRELLLSSTSIWASSFDLDCLDQRTDEWREEVLKRTGKASLSILGALQYGRPSTEFFLSILNKHWARVRNLCLVVHMGVFDDIRWSYLKNPAPNLEIFHVNLDINNHEHPAPPVFLDILNFSPSWSPIFLSDLIFPRWGPSKIKA